ncbi:MAG TPA: peptidylprolyl isomerase [Burkholderiales bacterium]|nr:peptidylprolyl isomerase [Burkholderiales bacterium]
MISRTLAALLLAAPLLASAQAQPKEAIATVNGVPVPKARLEYVMKQQQARGAPDSEETRAAVRDNLINREVVAQVAQKSPVARSAEVQNQLEIARQQILIDAYIGEWIRKNPVSDAEIQKEYERVKAQQGDREYKARHILVETEDQAKALIADLKKGASFAELAEKNSTDPGTKARGGDLDWNVPAVFDKAFSEAMMKLEKGKYTEAPVRTRFGFHVIKLEDVREVKFPTLAEVKPRIQQQLVQNKVNEMVRSLRAKAKVE